MIQVRITILSLLFFTEYVKQMETNFTKKFIIKIQITKKMKKIALFIILLINVNVFLYSQTFKAKIDYQAILLKQKTSAYDTIKSKKVKKLLLNLLTNNNELNYTLTINNNVSLFKKVKKLDIRKNILLDVLVGGGSFYYNRENNLLINEIDAYGDVFLISYPKTEWKITNETKKINGYLCGKAITTLVENSRARQTSTIIAWFAYDLPYNFGPNQFTGLPGLVLELDYIGKYKLRATKIELNTKEKIKIEFPKKGIKMSLEKYEKKLEELFVKRRIRSQN